MSGLRQTIDPSATSPEADIWFTLPPGFVPLPLRDLNAVQHGAAGGPDGVLQPLVAVTPAAARQQMLTDLGPVIRMAQMLLEAGAVHSCLGLHRDDEGDAGTLLSLFSLAWRPARWAPRSVLAARAASAIANPDHLEFLDLPCGPASLVQIRIAAPTEPGLIGKRQLLQVTAFVPCPEGERLAILTLATTAVDRADQYRAVLRIIAESVSFEYPLPDTPDED